MNLFNHYSQSWTTYNIIYNIIILRTTTNFQQWPHNFLRRMCIAQVWFHQWFLVTGLLKFLNWPVKIFSLQKTWIFLHKTSFSCAKVIYNGPRHIFIVLVWKLWSVTWKISGNAGLHKHLWRHLWTLPSGMRLIFLLHESWLMLMILTDESLRVNDVMHIIISGNAVANEMTCRMLLLLLFMQLLVFSSPAVLWLLSLVLLFLLQLLLLLMFKCCCCRCLCSC